ncbi:uncharacterized protein LOC113174511 isoform X2 [Anabas testudineus]|uniref:uncharacterized protein LOC113174511 isoform X2 n=1 Tax=Anabas testudineus TaxID=64144 RepID=UPI00143DFB99|nr:uncharacterized protein LOC113174511 isoform X2 [Anabas testudineus]
MGKTQSKGKAVSTLEGDEKYMETQCAGAGRVSQKKWRKRHGFSGKLKVEHVLELQSKLKLEMMKVNKEKRKKKRTEYKLSDKWLEQSKARECHQCLLIIFAIRADYGKIGHNSDPNSAYRQQLKMAFVRGLRDPVQLLVKKQWVNIDTGSVQEAVNHAKHATRVLDQKDKMTGAFTNELTSFRGRGRGRGRGNSYGRRRGGYGRGRSPYHNKQQQKDEDYEKNQCYVCQKGGHFAANCPDKNNQPSA